jgi:DNA-binding MarR family transcriptional regulator
MALEYVNNADLNRTGNRRASCPEASMSGAKAAIPKAAIPKAASTGPAPDKPDLAAAIDFELIELFFFAYRDFVADPDRNLADLGFGRAHHRVLHFVNRQPGLTIAELLDILQITKQSLNRVLKELVETGYVEQRAGNMDRRQRLLFATPKGRALAISLARLQADRIARALTQAGSEARDRVAAFLTAMQDVPRPDTTDNPAAPGASASGASTGKSG